MSTPVKISEETVGSNAIVGNVRRGITTFLGKAYVDERTVVDTII
jgi:hypothetical protein